VGDYERLNVDLGFCLNKGVSNSLQDIAFWATKNGDLIVNAPVDNRLVQI